MSSNDTRVEFFEVGDKTALLCMDPVTTESVQTTLKSLGFKTNNAETADVAIERLRYTQYDCIVVQESFAGSSLRSNAVLNYIMPLTMTLRRHSFVCLVGSSFKTLDAMQAFAQSVHLVVNPVDLPNLTAILKKGLTEFDLLYRVYKETLAKA